MSKFSPQLQEVAARELARRELARRQAERRQAFTFRDFVGKANPKYQFYKHCEVLADIATRIARGELKRVMLFVPPRHSKSETISRLFTAYYLFQNPDKWVGLTSYSAELAFVLSRASQENYTRAGGALSQSAGAVKHWETGQGGGLWAAGVGGPITGKGFHLGVIDDPLKNSQDASSAVIREKQKEWYRSTFYTRAEPDAAIVVIQTRWNEDDLSGWLLSEENESDEPEKWHVVNLPAIAEDAPKIPATCTLEADWRQPGEALCPERYTARRLEQIRERIGGYYFSALYQQRPSAKEGDFFKVSKIEIVPAAPAGLRECRAWDLAASSGRGDFTAGVKIGRDASGAWYVLDVSRGQWSPDERNAELRQRAATDGRGCLIRIAQDPGQAGVDQVQALTRMMSGYNVKSERPTGSKETRADAFAAQVNVGNVRLVVGKWNAAFLEELRQFPNGKNDDQVDAASDGFNQLALGGEFSTTTWGTTR